MSTTTARVLRFVVLVGIVNLFSDMTYEGARGVAGAFLGHLGASGAVIGAVAGASSTCGSAMPLTCYAFRRSRLQAAGPLPQA